MVLQLHKLVYDCVKMENSPYNSDTHGQTSQPLGSFDERTRIQIKLINILPKSKCSFAFTLKVFVFNVP